LINLLVNAIKFTAAADQRNITLTLDATHLRPCLPGESSDEVSTSFGRAKSYEAGLVHLIFEVKDTGIGMSEAEIQRVFQRFVQGSNRTHLTYGGSGLGEFDISLLRFACMLIKIGLFICRRIAQLLGGELLKISSCRSRSSLQAKYLFTRKLLKALLSRSTSPSIP
jgi:signal transduction histidine kinase